MKNIFIVLFITLFVNLKSQSEFKFCELVGFEKFLSSKIIVAVDSGATSRFSYDLIKDTVDVEKAAEYKNEKFYVSTSASLFEGKQVLEDTKGKYIWKKVETNPSSTQKKVKVKTFNSMVDGMNYMGTQGWEFQQAYIVTMGNQNVYHWLLKKKIK